MSLTSESQLPEELCTSKTPQAQSNAFADCCATEEAMATDRKVQISDESKSADPTQNEQSAEGKNSTQSKEELLAIIQRQ